MSQLSDPDDDMPAEIDFSKGTRGKFFRAVAYQARYNKKYRNKKNASESSHKHLLVKYAAPAAL